MRRRSRSSEFVERRSDIRPAGCQRSSYESESLVELRERSARGLLLGFFLRPPLAAAELLAVDDGGAREAALVRRPLDRDLDVRHAAGRVRASSSWRSVFVVDAGRRPRLDVLGEGGDDGVLDGGEAVLEEERAERRLEDRARGRCG